MSQILTIRPRPTEGTLDAVDLCPHGYYLGTHCPSCGPAIAEAVQSIANPRPVLEDRAA